MKRLPPLACKILCLGIGVVMGGLGTKFYLAQTALSQAPHGTQQRAGKEGLINPLLACEVYNKLNVQEFQPFKDNVNAIIDDAVSKKQAEHVSVYFRALNSGRWIGINEDDLYVGASLMKLPIAFAYYRLAEKGLSLNDAITNDVDPKTVTEQTIPASQTITPDKTYSVKELLRFMLVYSDNAAMALLTKHVQQQDIDSIFSDISIQREIDQTNNIRISPDAYSSFFRILYNATYLSREASEELLQTLSESEYKDGLVAGVPPNITVAHKFGERAEKDQLGSTVSTELHDCGIVYFPDHPYVLCIMTRGQNINALSHVIQRISETLYQDFTEYWKRNAS